MDKSELMTSVQRRIDELSTLDLELPEILRLVWEMACIESKEYYDPNVRYT